MDDIAAITSRTLYLVLRLSAVPVAVATIIGLAVGLMQTVTQLQEQTLPFGIKLIAVFGTILVLMGWFSAELVGFARALLDIALMPQSKPA